MFKYTVEELEVTVREAAEKYYIDGTSLLTDDQFDTLEAELRQRKPDSDVFTLPGFGHTVTGKGKQGHIGTVVTSLAKAYIIDDIPVEIRSAKSLVVTPKLDGQSVVVYYKNGNLDRAVTRGNGVVGKDCLRHLKAMVPATIPLKITAFFRGETILDLSYREELKARNVPMLRNFSAGIINRDEVTEDDNMLRFIPYTLRFSEKCLIIYKDTLLSNLKTEYSFTGIPYKVITGKDLTQELLKGLYEDWKKMYPIDGVVLTMNDNMLQRDKDGNILEVSFAYKFRGESANVVVNYVEWNTGFTGRVVPTVIFTAPVFLSGANIQKTGGFNKSYIKTNGIGHGAIVELERAGEVIPYIRSIIRQAVAEIPTVCPTCGQPLVEEDVEIMCVNDLCSAKLLPRIKRFIDTVASVLGFGDSILEIVINGLNLTDVDGLLAKVKESTVDEIVNQISSMMPLTDHIEKMIRLVFESLRRSCVGEGIPTDKFIYALGLPALGNSASEKLAGVDLNLSWTAGSLSKEGVKFGLPKPAVEAIKIYFDLIQKCGGLCKTVPRTVVVKSGRQVVITGALSMPRKDFEKLLVAKGFIMVNIKKGVEFLITNETDSTSSKAKKAHELGIKFITETEFLEMVK